MDHKKISEFKSKKHWVDYIWQRLLEDIKHPALRSALDHLLSSYEKNIIVNRLAAVLLIREGKTYRQIGEELWLSHNTIRSLKRVLDNPYFTEYQSYRLLNNKRKKLIRAEALKKAEEEIARSSALLDWVDYYISVFPKKHGPRWKFLR